MNNYENDFEDEEAKYYEEYFDEYENDNSMTIIFHNKNEHQPSYKKTSKQQTINITTKTNKNIEITTNDSNLIESNKTFYQITEPIKIKQEETDELPKYQEEKVCKEVKRKKQEIYSQHNKLLKNNEIQFKEDFYSIFLNNIKGKRIIPKDKVILIHNSICEEAGVRRMTRNEYRVINNYFKHFANFRTQIIQSIIHNKERLSKLIDLPSIIQRANEITESRKQKYNKQITIDNKE